MSHIEQQFCGLVPRPSAQNTRASDFSLILTTDLSAVGSPRARYQCLFCKRVRSKDIPRANDLAGPSFPASQR
jgi:hypothetical protein